MLATELVRVSNIYVHVCTLGSLTFFVGIEWNMFVLYIACNAKNAPPFPRYQYPRLKIHTYFLQDRIDAQRNAARARARLQIYESRLFSGSSTFKRFQACDLIERPTTANHRNTLRTIIANAPMLDGTLKYWFARWSWFNRRAVQRSGFLSR